MVRFNKDNKPKNIDVRSMEVKSIREYNGTTFFTLVLNGVSINGCRIASGKDSDFVAFPSYKAKDGKYYNHCYARLSEEDTDKIIKEIENNK